METIPFGKNVIRIEDDQTQCRKLILKHGMASMLSKRGPGNIVTGALMEGDPKGYIVIHPRGTMRAYMFTEPMTVREAMPIVVAMAEACSSVVKLPMKEFVVDDRNN